jgi:hypothetical protein
MFLPACPSSLRSYFPALFLGHGLETSLPADLTAFASDCGHVCGDIRRGCGVDSCGRSDWLRLFTGRLIYDPLGKLVRIARTFALTDGHETIMPQPECLSECCGYSN